MINTNNSKIGDFVFVPVTTGEPTSSAIATAVATAVATVINSIRKGQPNPNDWKGWNQLDQREQKPIGTSVTGWIIKDGQSIQNEALNILSYIQEFGFNNVIGYNKFWNRNITIDDLYNKLTRGGYIQEANQIKQIFNKPNPIANLFQPSNSNQSGISPIFLLAIVGGAIFLFTRKKRKK